MLDQSDRIIFTHPKGVFGQELFSIIKGKNFLLKIATTYNYEQYCMIGVEFLHEQVIYDFKTFMNPKYYCSINSDSGGSKDKLKWVNVEIY